MTFTAREVRNSPVLADDGSIGHVEDIYFDDQTWNIRYLVIDTRNWLPGRKVLVSPQSVVAGVSPEGVRVRLTREQIRKSPDVSTDRPVSKRMQASLADYYAWSATPMGWMPSVGMPSVAPAPIPAALPLLDDDGDPHLRSMNEVIGYWVEASQQTIGSVEDFAIRYEAPVIDHLVVQLQNGAEDRVRIPAGDVTEIDFDLRVVRAKVPLG